MSLAEKHGRLEMHPADQFEAFAASSTRATAPRKWPAIRRGGKSRLKRMKLARVAPELLAEYRKRGMTLECLMAFTVIDDHRRQLKVFKALTDWQKEDPKPSGGSHREDGRIPRQAGPVRRLDAYVAAGGSTAPTCSAMRCISKSPPSCTSWLREAGGHPL